MSDTARGPDRWLASDRKSYPPELHPDHAGSQSKVSQASSQLLPGTSDDSGASHWNQRQGVEGPSAVPTTTMFFGSQAGDRTPSSSRSGRRLVGLLAVVGAALVLTVSLVLVLGSSNGGLSGKTAAQVLAITVAAAKSQGSMHLDNTDTRGPAGSGSYDVNGSEGKQTVSGGTQGNSDLLVIPGHAYLNGDAAFLENSLGFPASVASLYSGKWISFVPSDPGYQQIVAGDTLSSALAETSPTGALTLTPTRSLDGQTVEGISGGLPRDIGEGRAKGSQVLYVSTTTPYLPVEVVTSGSLDGQSGTTVVTFSQWSESISIVPPKGATSMSSISSNFSSSSNSSIST